MLIKGSKVSCLAVLAVLGAFLLNLLASPGAPPAPEYMGEKKCKKCHIKEYKSWSETKHAKAFEDMPEKYRKDEKCLKCHTTGMGEGGFKSVDETPDLVNVQCEACHGPGGDHIPLTTQLRKDKVEKDKYPENLNINSSPTGCTKCHNPHVEHPPVD